MKQGPKIVINSYQVIKKYTIDVNLRRIMGFIKLFYSLHYTSFPFLKGCRLEKGHIVPVVCVHS